MTDAAAPSPPGRAPTADADILRLLHAGDVAAAFALVMARYQGKLYRLCVAYLRNPTLAQDVAQDSLVRIWRALPRYDGRAALSTFLYVITRNRCLTALATRPPTSSLHEPSIEAAIDRLPTTNIQAERDTSQSLRRLVEELPDATRRIITLYYFEQQSVAEVAALLGLPDGTVKTHLFRARGLLQSRLKALDLYDSAIWQC